MPIVKASLGHREIELSWIVPRDKQKIDTDICEPCKETLTPGISQACLKTGQTPMHMEKAICPQGSSLWWKLHTEPS